mgnify:CR=1 FL=1
MSKQQANISLSKIFKNHKSKEAILYLVSKDKNLLNLFIEHSNFEKYKREKNLNV